MESLEFLKFSILVDKISTTENLPIELLEFTHVIVADFTQREWFKWEQGRSHNAFYDLW